MGRCPGPRPDARPALRHRRVRGNPRLRDAEGHGRVPPERAPGAPAALGGVVRDGPRPVHGGPGRGDPRDDRIERRGLLLRAADRVPRLRRDGPVRAQQPRRRGDRGLAVGRLPGRGRAGDRRPLQGVELPPLRAQHDAAGCEGLRPVHQLGARQARGHAQRLRRGDPPERAGVRRRRLRRERVRGARRRAVHAAHQRFLPAGHHARERHPDGAVARLRGARGDAGANRPLLRR